MGLRVTARLAILCPGTLLGVLAGMLLVSPVWGESHAYAGDETCAGCHADLLGAYGKTLHARVLTEANARTPLMRRGCEGCHGPGRAHVEAAGGRGTVAPGWVAFRSDEDVDLRNGACLQCHEGGHQRHWTGSEHEQRGIACTSCHAVMRRVSSRKLLAKADEIQTCGQCHRLPRSQIWRNAHMPLRRGPASRDLGSEGWMSCSACHQPHGSVADAMIDAVTVNDSCYSCHADKRGPFLWEHAPVAESCLNCHDPHGSIHPGMLALPPPRLCQSCHNETLHPTEARSPGNRFVVGRNCQSCHQKVHGSNHPSGMALTR